MKIKLTNEIESVCGRFILPVNTELTVTDTDEHRGVYEASYNDGFFVVPFQCAEGIIEPLGGEKCCYLTYNSKTNKVEYDLPNLDMKLPKEWEFKESIKPQIERNGPKIKLLRALMSNCGQCKASENLVLDIIHTDNDKKIYLCKGPFSEAVTYDVPFFYGEIIEEEKTKDQSTRPFKIKIIKILPGMDHSGINLGDELYPITWKKDCYGVEVDSYRWVIPKEAAKVIETRPVDESVLDQFKYNEKSGELERVDGKPMEGNVNTFLRSSYDEAKEQAPPSDYHLPNVFSGSKYFDYYMFARAQQAAGLVIDPEIAHVQKKLFVPYRGHKSTKQDVIECIKTLQLWLENNEL